MHSSVVGGAEVKVITVVEWWWKSFGFSNCLAWGITFRVNTPRTRGWIHITCVLRLDVMTIRRFIHLQNPMRTSSSTIFSGNVLKNTFNFRCFVSRTLGSGLMMKFTPFSFHYGSDIFAVVIVANTNENQQKCQKHTFLCQPVCSLWLLPPQWHEASHTNKNDCQSHEKGQIAQTFQNIIKGPFISWNVLVIFFWVCTFVHHFICFFLCTKTFDYGSNYTTSTKHK